MQRHFQSKRYPPPLLEEKKSLKRFPFLIHCVRFFNIAVIIKCLYLLIASLLSTLSLSLYCLCARLADKSCPWIRRVLSHTPSSTYPLVPDIMINWHMGITENQLKHFCAHKIWFLHAHGLEQRIHLICNQSKKGGIPRHPINYVCHHPWDCQIQS